jgi:hypothetical protein
MRRRRFILGSLLLLLLMLGAASLVWIAAGREGGGVNPDSYGRIEKGMSIPEVIGILGAPPDGGTGAGDVDIWMGPDAIVAVWFDKPGRVTAKKYTKQPAHYRVKMILKWLASRF